MHGSGVHTRDARYVLDRDGDLTTREDQLEIGKADQSYFENVTEGVTEQLPMWSGFREAGLQELQAGSKIILRGGNTGIGITADVLMLMDLENLAERYRNHYQPSDQWSSQAA